MHLDSRTVVAATVALSTLLLSLATAAVWWTRQTYPGFGRWTIANLTLTLAMLLVAMQSIAPVWLDVVAANTLIVGAMILALEGTRKFRGLTPRIWSPYAVGGITVLALLYFAYMTPSVNARVTIMSSFMAIMAILCSVTLRKDSPAWRGFTVTFTSGMFAVMAAIYIARAVYFQFGPRYVPLLDDTPISQASYLAATLALLASFGGFLLMTDERVMMDLKEAERRVLRADAEVTERRHAEAVLRESEQRFRTLTDSAPVMICVSGPDKLATFFNKRWLDFTGRTLEQQLGYGWLDGVHPEDLDRTLSSYSASFDARVTCNIEYRLRRVDGEYRWVLCSGVPRLEPGGAFGGYYATVVDITDVMRAQEETLVRQKRESLGVLTGGIAHDFNNLLGNIVAEAELAETELAAGSSPGEEIRRIKAVAIRAAEVVRELMTYSGQDQANLEPVDVSLLIEDMLELIKVSIPKSAVLKTELPKNLSTAWGNAPQIRQIVMNLIMNASETIGEKSGVINVTTSSVTGGPELAPNGPTNLPEGQYVRLDVSDTGDGMTEEVKAKIFDPFFTTKFAGRGLGLAVLQGIVRAHGGAINVISAPGQGSTFQILLPCDCRPAENPNVTARVWHQGIPGHVQ